MTIGQRIAQKRKEQGLSQEALGERLGLSRQAIYKWESDTALPEIEKLIALSRLFGVSVGWLLGVEEDAAPESSADHELTEAQLKMIEEIVNRYTAAMPQPKKRRRWPFVLAGIVLFFPIFNLFEELDVLRQQQESIHNNISRVENSVDHQIGAITSRVEEILKSQNDLTADYGTELISTDLTANTATFSFRAVPKTFQEGMTAFLIVDNNGVTEEFGPYAPAGQTFSGEVTVELTDSTNLSIVFEQGGVRQTQLLDTYNYLYSDTMPDGDVHDDLMWLDLETPGILTLPEEHDQYVWVQQFEQPHSGGTSTEAKVIQVGLFKNQELMAWAEPCGKPDSFHGFEDCTFYRLPEVRVPLTADDILQVTAVVTDEYGRVSVWPGIPYIMDQENMELTPPANSTLDSNPAHWTFD